MIYLLDTDIVIYWIKGNRNISKNIISIGYNNISSSIITKTELLYGAYKSQNVEKNLETIHKLSKKMQFLDFSDSCQHIYARIKVGLVSKGMILDDLDTMIAATAIAYDLILVTNNSRHFSRIPNLIIENWV